MCVCLLRTRNLQYVIQNEWSQFLIQDDSWEHYSIHRPEPHVLLFRRPLSSREEPPSETSLRADANADIECKIQEEDQQQLSAVDEERRQARSRTGDTFEAKDDTDDECDDENQEEQNDSGDQHDNDGRGGGESKSTSKLTRRHVINAKVSPPLRRKAERVVHVCVCVRVCVCVLVPLQTASQVTEEKLH